MENSWQRVTSHRLSPWWMGPAYITFCVAICQQMKAHASRGHSSWLAIIFYSFLNFVPIFFFQFLNRRQTSGKSPVNWGVCWGSIAQWAERKLRTRQTWRIRFFKIELFDLCYILLFYCELLIKYLKFARDNSNKTSENALGKAR